MDLIEVMWMVCFDEEIEIVDSILLDFDKRAKMWDKISKFLKHFYSIADNGLPYFPLDYWRKKKNYEHKSTYTHKIIIKKKSKELSL